MVVLDFLVSIHACRKLWINFHEFFAVGVLTQISFPAPEINKDDKIAVAASINNCGLTEKCSDNQFPVHVYTGRDNNDEPKICVDGKYVIAKGINDAGRGLNIAVVSNGKEVIRTGHFDTWQEGRFGLEIQLCYREKYFCLSLLCRQYKFRNIS